MGKKIEIKIYIFNRFLKLNSYYFTIYIKNDIQNVVKISLFLSLKKLISEYK